MLGTCNIVLISCGFHLCEGDDEENKIWGSDVWYEESNGGERGVCMGALLGEDVGRVL